MDNEPQIQAPVSDEVSVPPSVAELPTTLETLGKFAEASKSQRLAPAEEERATALLIELLSEGKEGIVSAMEPLISLPWVVSVNAVSALWAGFKPLTRRRLMVELAKNGSEQARRLRLSLARAIFKIEPPAGVKLAAATAADLKDPDSGALSSRSRQSFFNVFIGKGKPWLLQLPLVDLKGAEADALVHCAIQSFSLCPPLSQLSILKWAYGAGRFKKLAPPDLEIAVKSVARWNVKLQRQLTVEIPDLPEAITKVLKPEAKAPPTASETAVSLENDRRSTLPAAKALTASGEAEAAQVPDAAEQPETSGDVTGVATTTGQTEAAQKPATPIELVIPRRAARLERAEAEQAKGRQKSEPPAREHQIEERREDQREERRGGSREERHREEKGRKTFDFRESLRGLESYVAGLRSELEQTKAQLRRREDEAKSGGRTVRLSAEVKPAVDVEALLRHNAQLEATVEQLRQQLEDLSSHHEAVAESRLLHTDQSLAEGSAGQLSALLAIKLIESYSTYKAMCAEPLDRVFRLDYRDLLGTVFEVLLKEGVKLDAHP